ncbi:MAG: LytTR family transcriptional regulator DNA-binding domain-containing protein [Ferruginibacter sp.]
MNDFNSVRISRNQFETSPFGNKKLNDFQILRHHAESDDNAEPGSINEDRLPSKKEKSPKQLLHKPVAKSAAAAFQNTFGLLRLFLKNGEYVYARPNDIILMESCDHLVKVYLAFDDKIKKTIRHNTLKDFLSVLPEENFMRIGRFCAVNVQRLSGGNCNEQTFEFDFKVSIKLSHAISQTAFGNIGR